MRQQEFIAPGPGNWNLDRVHGPRPSTRLVAETLGQPFAEGFGEMFKRYGMLLLHPLHHHVNGWDYLTMVPAPPEEIPERFANAETVFATKQWRIDLDRWEGEVKPDSRARNRALAAVDPDSLEDAALLDHLTAARDNLAVMITRHHQFNGAAMVPTGDLLAHAMGWGLPVPELLALLKGVSPTSGGDCDETAALVEALRADPESLALVQQPDAEAATVIESLLARPGAVGEAARAFVGFVGHRPVDGFDICEPILMERPEVLLITLRHALEGPRVLPDVEGEAKRIRDLVPQEQRATFDELLEEARLTYRVRDERGVYQDAWAFGILRRAVLAAGRRLAASGRIHEAEHIVDAGYDEIRSLVASGDGPSADELADRHQFRVNARPGDAPDFIGDPPSPPPPFDGLPPAVARVMGAFSAAMGALFQPSDKAHDAGVVRGLPVSTGSYEGTARVLSGPSEMWRLEDGDVLVTASTTESFNVALPMLGGIVTDNGGLLSHAAIVAREFGLPCVVGTREGTRLIPDGARVRVDGDRGEVHVLPA